MFFTIAIADDIDGVLELQKKYHIHTIAENDKKDGFVTTSFSREQLTKLATEEKGLFIAKDNEEVVAYVMAAAWKYWAEWPMFVFMISTLSSLEYLGQSLTTENSYQYGPVCIDKKYRGSGLLENIFDFSREEMSKRFPILVTFINTINQRSYEAHSRKLGLEVVQQFEYNNNSYYELVYDTSKTICKLK